LKREIKIFKKILGRPKNEHKKASLLFVSWPFRRLHSCYVAAFALYRRRCGIRGKFGRYLGGSRAGAKEKAYKLVYSDDKGKKGSFVVHLVKLENRLFLDVLPSQFPSEQQDWEKMKWAYNFFFFVPAHTFMKIDSIEPQLKMRRTVSDEMKELLKEEPNVIKHELVEDKIILMASTKELQAFVLKYAYDIRVFPAKIVLTRKKNKGAQESAAQDPNEG
jgi:hypothetical protein